MLTLIGKKIYSGSFNLEIDAALYYDHIAINIHGLEVIFIHVRLKLTTTTHTNKFWNC